MAVPRDGQKKNKAAPENYQTPMTWWRSWSKNNAPSMFHAFSCIGGWRWRSMKSFNFHFLDYPSLKPLPTVTGCFMVVVSFGKNKTTCQWLKRVRKVLSSLEVKGLYLESGKLYISELLWMLPWNGHRLETSWNISTFKIYTGPIWLH